MSETTQSVAEVLRKAKALIDTPEKWVKGNYTKHESGEIDDEFRAKDCIAFCSLGAIARVVESDLNHQFSGATEFLRRALPSHSSIWMWNDNMDRTHAEVMAAFDRAIELAEKERAHA